MKKFLTVVVALLISVQNVQAVEPVTTTIAGVAIIGATLGVTMFTIDEAWCYFTGAQPYFHHKSLEQKGDFKIPNKDVKPTEPGKISKAWDSWSKKVGEGETWCEEKISSASTYTANKIEDVRMGLWGYKGNTNPIEPTDCNKYRLALIKDIQSRVQVVGCMGVDNLIKLPTEKLEGLCSKLSASHNKYFHLESCGCPKLNPPVEVKKEISTSTVTPTVTPTPATEVKKDKTFLEKLADAYVPAKK